MTDLSKSHRIPSRVSSEGSSGIRLGRPAPTVWFQAHPAPLFCDQLGAAYVPIRYYRLRYGTAEYTIAASLHQFAWGWTYGVDSGRETHNPPGARFMNTKVSPQSTAPCGARPLQVSVEFVGGSSGPGYSIPALNDALRRQGCPSRLAGLRWPGMPAGADSDAQRAFCPVYPVIQRGASAVMRSFISESIASGSSNLLHCHCIWLMPPVYCAKVAHQNRCPFILSPRGTLSQWSFRQGSMLKRIAWPLMQRGAVRDASCFHATSIAESEEIRGHGFRQPIAVIPNGIDLPPNLPDPADRDKVVLFLSRIHPKKGIEDLLLAWHRLHRRHESWTVKIAGPLGSDYARTLQRRAVELALPRLSFLGELSGARKWDALGRAGLFVLPTRSENFGVAVAEALAAGTPVVVSKGAPWSGVVRQKCGWWHEIGPDGLEEALDQAMALPLTDLHAYGEAGRAWMERDFNWDAIAAQMRAVYEWQLGNAPRPTCVV